MLAIVRIALRRLYTFIEVALLILLLGVFSALRMPVDIFPIINIPVIGVAWVYQGISPDQMVGRIMTRFEPITPWMKETNARGQNLDRTSTRARRASQQPHASRAL